MRAVSAAISGIFVAFFAFVLLSVVLPRVYAAGTAADAMCVPVKEECSCGLFKDAQGKCTVPGNKFMCPCSDSTSGFTTSGICVSSFKCEAKSSDGKPPEMPKPPEKKPSEPGQKGDPCASGGGAAFGGISGIVARKDEVVGTTSTSTASNPCPATDASGFNTNVSSGFDTSSIFNSSNPVTAGITDLVSSLFGGTTERATTNAPPATIGTTASSTGGTSSQKPPPPFGSYDGISGDIRIAGTAVTILASNRDIKRGTQISAFNGAESPAGATPAAIYTSVCANRPWAKNFLSLIISPTFFDALCTIRGYKIEPIARTAVPVPTKNTPRPSTAPPPAPKPAPVSTTTAATGPAPEPDIWAVPTAVPSGSRTTIFWNSKNADSCTVASRDGQFSQTGLSGGRASQPLTAATTFTISCTSAKGVHASDFVTVGLSQ